MHVCTSSNWGVHHPVRQYHDILPPAGVKCLFSILAKSTVLQNRCACHMGPGYATQYFWVLLDIHWALRRVLQVWDTMGDHVV